MSRVVELVKPGPEHLASFVEAIELGYREIDDRYAAEQLRLIEEDPDRFLALMDDRLAEGPPIVLPTGTVPRMPGLSRWVWDGDFCGRVSLRWQEGSTELPPTCLGHIGYSIVPWKRRLGYATEALRLALPIMAAEGLPYVYIDIDPDNFASRRVTEANGGVLLFEFEKPPVNGGGPCLRYRIDL